MRFDLMILIDQNFPNWNRACLGCAGPSVASILHSFPISCLSQQVTQSVCGPDVDPDLMESGSKDLVAPSQWRPQ